MGKMPLKLYQEDESGGRVRAPTDETADLLMYRPNPIMTPSTFWSTIETNCEHYGNAYVWIQTQFVQKGSKYGGKYIVKGFWPMQSDCVDVLMDDTGVFGAKGQLYYRYLIRKQERPIHSGRTVYYILRPGIPGTALWENQYAIS